MPRTLILEPTANWPPRCTKNFSCSARTTSLNIALLMGGVSFDEQNKIIDRGADVLIATPGRLLDHMERGKLMLTHIESSCGRSRPDARHGLHSGHRADRQVRCR
jgi:superfamily II DNA/RNA helicase